MGLLFLIIVAGLALWAWARSNRFERFRTVAKDLEQDLEGFAALPEEGFGREEFKKAWFRGKWHEPRLDGYESWGLISGSFRGVPVRIAAVDAWYETESQDEEESATTSRHTIFKGTMMHLQGVLDRPLGRDLRVLPAGAVRRAAERFGLRGKGSVDLEDPEWRKTFRVLGDQVESRVVFTPERMRALLEFSASEGWRLSFLFRGADLYIFWRKVYLKVVPLAEAAGLIRRLIGLPWELGLTSRPAATRSGERVRVEDRPGVWGSGWRRVRREEAEAAGKPA